MLESHDADYIERGGRRDMPVKIPLSQWRFLRELSRRQGVAQKDYLRRLLACVEILESRSGGDPVKLLEVFVGHRDPP